MAWDIALGVDIIRESVFCDYLDEPTARKMMDDLDETSAQNVR